MGCELALLLRDQMCPHGPLVQWRLKGAGTNDLLDTVWLTVWLSVAPGLHGLPQWSFPWALSGLFQPMAEHRGHTIAVPFLQDVKTPLIGNTGLKTPGQPVGTSVRPRPCGRRGPLTQTFLLACLLQTGQTCIVVRWLFRFYLIPFCFPSLALSPVNILHI